MKLNYIPLIMALILPACHLQSPEPEPDEKYAPMAAEVPVHSTIEYDGFTLTPGDVLIFCAIRLKLTDKEWEKFKSLRNRPGTLRAKSYHARIGQAEHQECYRLEELPGIFTGKDSPKENIISDPSEKTDILPPKDLIKSLTKTLPEERRLVGYEKWMSFSNTRKMRIAERNSPMIECFLDISGNEICDVGLSEKERYKVRGQVPKDKFLELDYQEALKYNYERIAGVSRYKCEHKLIALHADINYFPIDLSQFCFYIGKTNNKILCQGKKASEKDALELNHYNYHRMLDIMGIEQSRKLHDIHRRDVDIAGGRGIEFVMLVCNLNEFLRRNRKDLNIYRHQVFTHADAFRKCDNSVNHKVIFYGYDEGSYDHRPSFSVIDNINTLREFHYGIDTKLDENVIEAVDFEKNVVLSLRGIGYYQNGYNIKVYDVCSGSPTTAYLVQDGLLVDHTLVRPSMLLEVPKGEYQVDFVYWADEFCGIL
jgi:hypothetical protein